MKIQITKKFLSTALDHVSRVIPARSNNPILSYVRLKGEYRHLAVSGTNVEIDTLYQIPAQIDGEWNVLVPGHLLAQLVRNSPAEILELTMEGTNLVMQGGGGRVTLGVGTDDKSFPPLSFQSHGEKVSIKALTQALATVRYAVASEAFQQVFRGVLFEATPARLRVVASDGFRLALSEFTGEISPTKFIVPISGVDELLKMCAKLDGDVQLHRDGHILTVIHEQFKLNIRLLEGEYPDYQRVIPHQPKVKIRLSREKLIGALQRCALLADKSANNRVTLNILSQLTLNADGDYGTATEVLDIERTGPEAGQFVPAVNAVYMVEALSKGDGDCTVEFSGIQTPMLIKSGGKPDDIHVVVPLRV